MSLKRISLDAMGGDFGYKVVVPAAISVLEKCPNLHLILVGDDDTLQSYLAKYSSHAKERLSIKHASQVVAMDEAPALALRKKKDSSMRVAINLVKSLDAQACVSSGNTGALMATARFVLKTLPGINRPAIIRSLPTEHHSRKVRILDLGANIDCSSDTLFQFAIMGSALTSAVDHIENPKVALLNIGQEDIKGSEIIKEASSLLSNASGINYMGYIEADKIFKAEADVIVCDGFVGNVTLKCMEGEAKFIQYKLKEAFSRNIFTKLAGCFALPVLKDMKRQLNPERYNGASLVGLRGIVVKSHGGTTVKGFEAAIEQAILEVENNVPDLINKQVAQQLTGSCDQVAGCRSSLAMTE